MVKNRDEIVFRIYRLFYIIPSLIFGMIMMHKGTTIGEETSDFVLPYESVEVFLFTLLHIITLELSVPLFYLSKKIRISYSDNTKGKRFTFSRKAHSFLLVILIAQIVYTLLSGNMVDSAVGETSRWASNGLSQFFNIIKVTSIFPIYYICGREKDNKLYWLNIILYLVWRIVCGWSGDILTIGIMELYMRNREGKFKLPKLLVGSTSVALFLLGSLIYKFIWPIKNQIRYGFSLGDISYGDAFEKLLSRFTNLPISFVGLINNDKIAQMYKLQGKWDAEIMVTFRTLLPRFVMPDKTFRPLANLVKQSIWADITNGTGTGYNRFVQSYNLLCSDVFCFIVWNIVLVIFLILSVKVIKAFDRGDNSTDILIFLLCFSIANGGNLEAVFGYGYLGLIYMLPIMMVFGMVKYKRIHENNSNNAVYSKQHLCCTNKTINESK